LASARVLLPWLAGEASAGPGCGDTTRFHADALTLTLPQGRVSLGPQASRNIGPIRLNAIASATLEGREPRLEVRGLDIGGLLLAQGGWGLHPGGDGRNPGRGDPPGRTGENRPGSPLARQPDGHGPYGQAPLPPPPLHPRNGTCIGPGTPPPGFAVFLANAGFGATRGSLLAEGPFQDWLHGRASLLGRIRGTGHLERRPLAVRQFRFDAPLAGRIAAPTLPGWTLSVGAER